MLARYFFAVLITVGIYASAEAQEAQLGFPIVDSDLDEDSSGCEAPTVADVDGDGLPEILVSFHGYGLCVFKHDGTQVPGWPYLTVQSKNVFQQVDGQAMVGDIDGDGEVDVVFQMPSLSYSDGADFFAVTAEGVLKMGWPIEIPETDGRVYDYALGDLDGDGAVELVVLSKPPSHTSVYAFHGDGTLVDGWPVDLKLEDLPGLPPYFDVYWGTLAVGDIDFDGKSEVSVGMAWYNASTDSRIAAPSILLNGDGQHRDGWSVFEPTVSAGMHDPAFADLDGDFSGELFGMAGDEFLAYCEDGSLYFPPQSHCFPRKVACGNLDDDPDLEIVVPGGTLKVFDLDVGTVAVNINLMAETDSPVYSNYEGMSLGDVDGDGKCEILVWSSGGVGNRVHLFNADLEELPGWPKESPRILSNVAWPYATCLADLDGDGDLEAIYTWSGTLQVWDLENDGELPSRVDWAMWGHDATLGSFYHTGALPPQKFLRGDADRDGNLQLVDGIFMGLHLFGDAESDCAAAMDFDGSGSLGVEDIIGYFSFLFLDGPSPAPPYPDCGEKPAGEELDCLQFVCE
ncbi:MAG: VCBS repeat-containing protein [Planctomycetes bacterium]|nr:VCBS repeat-containing protein [Planctomycetota bacterium]